MSETKARILYVEDHLDSRLVMAILLEKSGYGVITAGDVQTALQIARESDFDLFILDVRLPDGDGVALCKQLRGLQPSVPVLYYTAYTIAGHDDRVLSICGDAYLRKPTSIDELTETIEKLLQEGVADQPNCMAVTN